MHSRVVHALLDLDETLIDRSAAFDGWADSFCADAGFDATDREWLIQTDRRLRKRQAFFDAVVERWPGIGSAQALWDGYAREVPQFARPFPGVMDALHRLRAAGWLLVVVTNGRRDTQEAKMRVTGLANLLDAWVISGDVGVAKPDRRIFDLAVDLIGATEPAQCWMVGDDITDDIETAARLGMRTVWINHGRPQPEDFITTAGAATPADALALLR